MLEVRINRFKTKYWVSRNTLAGQRRLDQVKALLLDEVLEPALVAAGVPQDNEVCIRKIIAPIHLRLDGSVQGLAVEWGQALVAEVARALRLGPTENVVVFHLRRHALMDMAINVSRFDLRRAWAWRQLGLWRKRDVVNESEAVSEVVRELCAEPNIIVPALVALLDAGNLEGLARQLAVEQWQALASAALSNAGVAEVLNESSDVPNAQAIRDALRVLTNSRLVRAIASSCPLFAENSTVRRAVAALAVMDVEPTLLRASRAGAIVGIVADATQSRSAVTYVAGDRMRSEASMPLGTSVHDQQGTGCDPVVAEGEEETTPIDLRKRGRTQFGGLLFLLGVVDELDLPEEILAHGVLGARPFQWVIHQLALALVDVGTNDPVALAFSGLAPDATPPSEGQPAPDEIERETIAGFVSRITAHLNSLIERETDMETTLLDFVCHRHAEVVAEPGWIDLKLSVDNVSTELRRAGLDLNPGYLPWLGVVVRFVYE